MPVLNWDLAYDDCCVSGLFAVENACSVAEFRDGNGLSDILLLSAESECGHRYGDKAV